MGKLLIESEDKYLIENYPNRFSKETMGLYIEAMNEAENSDEYTIIGIDLATKDNGDYFVYTKMKLKDGKLIPVWSINESYAVKGNKDNWY